MHYNKLATEETIKKTITALSEHGFEPLVVETREEALRKIKSFIPKGASVMNGSSRTLDEIGFIDYLKSGKHGWNNLHAAIVAEKDPARQAQLRKEAVLADYYVGSVHGVSETGELVIASASGSQLPYLAVTAQNVILIVSTQKITPTVDDAFDRIEKYVLPLEDERMKEAYGFGTVHAKTIILHQESPMMG